MNQEKIGRFIAESRNQVGLTQKELAEKIGISKRHWTQFGGMCAINYIRSDRILGCISFKATYFWQLIV